MNGKDLNTLGKVVTSENVLNNVIRKCSGVDLECLKLSISDFPQKGISDYHKIVCNLK